MHKTIDARGLACPQPVIMTKEALATSPRVVVMVDNSGAVENVRRLGSTMGCAVTIDKTDETTYTIHLSRDAEAPAGGDPQEGPGQGGGSYVVAIASETMGRGSDELGVILMRSYIHTLLQLEGLPDTIIFYNTGVRLTVEGSDVIDDLHRMAELGVKILVCGTCTNYFDVTDSVAVGDISNMFEIAATMAQAGRLVAP